MNGRPEGAAVLFAFNRGRGLHAGLVDRTADPCPPPFGEPVKPRCGISRYFSRGSGRDGRDLPRIRQHSL